MPEDMSDRVPEDMPDRMPEDLPEDMPDRMPNRMSEDMSDRMPEDLPVRKCINVMVGITRSKVIFLVAKSLYTDGGASLMARQAMDLCKGWLRAASRNTFAFANWFRGGSCLARERYHVSAGGRKEGEILSLRCGSERVAGNWPTEASRGLGGFAGLRRALPASRNRAWNSRKACVW